MWRWKKKTPNGLPNSLPFKTPQGFFEMQCKYGGTKLAEGLGIVAIVLDARKEFGTSVAVNRQENGCQLAAIRVAGGDGGFVTFAETASDRGDHLKPDDIVSWVPYGYLPELGQKMGDARCGWRGFIMAKLAPEMPIKEGQPWTVLSEYA